MDGKIIDFDTTEDFTASVVDCSACNANHAQVLFIHLNRPIYIDHKRYDFRGTCPRTNVALFSRKVATSVHIEMVDFD